VAPPALSLSLPHLPHCLHFHCHGPLPGHATCLQHSTYKWQPQVHPDQHSIVTYFVTNNQQPSTQAGSKHRTRCSAMYVEHTPSNSCVHYSTASHLPAYTPPEASSAVWLPSSTSRPSDSTRMRSQPDTVLSLWATKMEVRPCASATETAGCTGQRQRWVRWQLAAAAVVSHAGKICKHAC
jgi:hypothetical protein